MPIFPFRLGVCPRATRRASPACRTASPSGFHTHLRSPSGSPDLCRPETRTGDSIPQALVPLILRRLRLFLALGENFSENLSGKNRWNPGQSGNPAQRHPDPCGAMPTTSRGGPGVPPPAVTSPAQVQAAWWHGPYQHPLGVPVPERRREGQPLPVPASPAVVPEPAGGAAGAGHWVRARPSAHRGRLRWGWLASPVVTPEDAPGAGAGAAADPPAAGAAAGFVSPRHRAAAHDPMARSPGHRAALPLPVHLGDAPRCRPSQCITG